jgi:hypothetical protein
VKLVPTFADREVSHGQCSGSLKAVISGFQTGLRGYVFEKGNKISIILDIAPCSPYMNTRFGGMYDLYLKLKKLNSMV